MRIIIAVLVARFAFGPCVVRAADVPAPAVAGTLTLPAAYDRTAVVGAGRFLVLRLVDGAGIAIVDVEERAIVHTIENPPSDAMIVGGRDVLLLISPGKRLVLAYGLGDFTRRAVAALPYEGTPQLALMGGSGNGPLLLGGTRAVLVDVDTLKPIELEGDRIAQWSRYGYVARVSADGRTFTGIPAGYGPVAYSQMWVGDRRTTTRTFGGTSHANRWAQPTADGHLMLLPGGGLFDAHLEPARVEWLDESTLYPTLDPAYFLSVRFVPEGTRVSVCTTADRRIVHSVVGLDEMAPRGNTNSRNAIAGRLLRGEERFHWFPEARTLVTLPYDDKSIVFRDLDLEASLAETGRTHVWVESRPPATAPVGSTYEYRLRARSTRGRPRYELVDGPTGAKVGRKGVLKWPVATTEPPGLRTIVVGITANDAELFHSFRVNVVSPPPAAAP